MGYVRKASIQRSENPGYIQRQHMRRGLLSTFEEQTKKTCAKNTLGLLSPPSDIEVQEQCIHMEEIEMQHRIH